MNPLLIIGILLGPLLGAALGKGTAQTPSAGQLLCEPRSSGVFSPARKPYRVLWLRGRPQQPLQRDCDHLWWGQALWLPGAQTPARPGTEQAVWKMWVLSFSFFPHPFSASSLYFNLSGFQNPSGSIWLWADGASVRVELSVAPSVSWSWAPLVSCPMCSHVLLFFPESQAHSLTNSWKSSVPWRQGPKF